MGFMFLVMGIAYSSDEGAVGSTGIYLILLGLLMLIIGGIAIFANLKKIWLIMFVVELINVALFLVRPTSPRHLAAPSCEVSGRRLTGAVLRRSCSSSSSAC